MQMGIEYFLLSYNERSNLGHEVNGWQGPIHMICMRENGMFQRMKEPKHDSSKAKSPMGQP